MKKTAIIFLVMTMLFSSFAVVSAAGTETYGFSYNSDDYFTANFAQTTGNDVALGDSGWRSVNATEGKMGRNNNAWFKIDNGKMYLNTRQGGRATTEIRYNNKDTDIPALVYATPSTYLTGDQTIKFNAYFNHETASFGVRFKVHNDGKNYYAVVFGGHYIWPNDGGADRIAYKIYKYVNGSIAGFKEVKESAINFAINSANYPLVTVNCIGNTINIDTAVYNAQGEEVKRIQDSWTDNSPFTFAEGDTATVWLTAAGAENDGRFVQFRDIEINSLVNKTTTYDDGILTYTATASYVGNTATESYATVTGMSSSPLNVEIPESITVDGVEYPVTTIGNGAFRNSAVRTFKLPSSITTISENAFRAANYLRSINIPANVTTIPAGALFSVGALNNQNYVEMIFEGTDISFVDGEKPALSLGGNGQKLKAVISDTAMKDALQTYSTAKGINAEYTMNGTYSDEILNYAIYAQFTADTTVATATVTGLASEPLNIEIPETISVGGTEYTVTAIGNDAFRNCTVRTIKLPASITTISENAFRAANYLRSVNIPANVTTLPSGAFFSIGALNGQDHVEVIFEGTAISFVDGEKPALSLGGNGQKLKAVVSHPAVEDAVKAYSANCLTEYAMLYEDGVVKFYAPKTLTDDMFVVAIYNSDSLAEAKIEFISKNEGGLYEYNLAEKGVDVSSAVYVKAFLLEDVELTPLTVGLNIK